MRSKNTPTIPPNVIDKVGIRNDLGESFFGNVSLLIINTLAPFFAESINLLIIRKGSNKSPFAGTPSVKQEREIKKLCGFDPFCGISVKPIVS